jgi:hypothetical protein
MFGGRRISAESSKFLVRKYEQVNSCPPGEARESNPCGVAAADATRICRASLFVRVNEDAALFRGEAKHRIAGVHRGRRIGRGDGNKDVIVFSEGCYGMNARPGRQAANKRAGVGIDNADRLSGTARGIEAVVACVIPNFIGTMGLVNCGNHFAS